MKYTNFLLLSLLILVSSCQRHIAGMDLEGDCNIASITLDSCFKGVMNPDKQTVTVGIPETYDVRAMRVTDLVLSEGATSDLQIGDVLNLEVARRIRVTNGDALLDWTLSTIRQQALITSFTLSGKYTGIIDNSHFTITVYVPVSEDVRSLIPSITVSEGATVSPASGVPQDFSSPVEFVVTNQTATSIYTVSVLAMQNPKVLFVGQAENISGLAPEEQEACNWLLQNIDRSMYASFGAIRQGAVDISECKLMWWHFHFDGGVDGKAQFDSKGAEAVSTITYLQNWFANGGSFLLTRYATYLPGYLSINGKSATLCFPNNCWGGKESEPETTSNAWYWITESPSHPLYANILKDSNADRIYTCDAGYKLTNSTAQWHLGSDWGGYPTLHDMQSKTGAVSLGHGGDNAVVVWEFPSSQTNGGIICIGSGCYDWYSTDANYSGYHQNVSKMTQNAITYLLNE